MLRAGKTGLSASIDRRSRWIDYYDFLFFMDDFIGSDMTVGASQGYEWRAPMVAGEEQVPALVRMQQGRDNEWRAPMALPSAQVTGWFDEQAEAHRRNRALQAFDVLAEGVDLSLRPNARKLAVDAFGEDFVRDWESSDGVVRDQLSGMRFNEFVMRRDGDDDVDGLMRYRELSGNRDVLSEVDMWRDYAGKRKGEIDSFRAARKAEGEKYAEILSRAVRGEAVTNDELAAVVKGGYSLADITAAGKAYTLMQTVDPDNYARAYDLITGSNAAMALCLSAMEDDAFKRYADSPVSNSFADSLRGMRRGFFEAVSEEAVSGRIVEHMAGYPMGDTALKYHGSKVATQDVDRPRYNAAQRAFVGDVLDRVDAGRERGMQQSGLFTVGASAMAELAGMMVSFSSYAQPFTVSDMLFASQARRESMGRAHAEPMDDETYSSLVQSVGRERADEMRADWQRQSSRAAIGAASIWYAGSEYVSMKIGLGAGGRVAARLAPGAMGRLASRSALRNRTFAGAYAGGVLRSGFDLGVAMPLARGGLDYLYDSMPWADSKLATGADELAGWYNELGSGRRWAGVLGMALAGGAPHAYGTRNNARRILAERKGAMVEGVTGEQFDSTLYLPERERVEKLAAFSRENREREPEEVIRRAIAACKDEVDRQKADEMRQDAAVEAAMQSLGYSIEASGEGGKGFLYYEGYFNERGEFERGAKRMELDADDLAVFVQQVLDAKANRFLRSVGVGETAQRMRDEMGKMRLVDAFRETVKGDVSVEWMRPEAMRMIEERGQRAAQRLEQRVREEMESNPAADEQELRRRVGEEVHDDLGDNRPLAVMIRRAEGVRQRAAIEEARGNVLDKNAPFSWAYVVTRGSGASKRRILRIAEGATVHEVAEEFGEQVMLDWMDAEGMDYVSAFMMLDSMRVQMARSGDKAARELADTLTTLHKREPGLYARIREDGALGNASELGSVRRDVIEALSRMMLSDFIRRVQRGEVELPQWSRALLDAAHTNAVTFAEEMELGAALAKAKEGGWMPEAVSRMLDLSEGGVREALAREASVEDFSSAWMEKMRRQAEFDSRNGRLRDPDYLDDFYSAAAAGQQQAEEERAAVEAVAEEEARQSVTELEEEGKTHEQAVTERAERFADAKQEETDGNPAALDDGAFCGGRCLEVEDETGLVCRGGLLEVDRLTILPNFKQGADAESGVVEPLRGDYRPDHDPIRVWQRADGSLQVISGRHRLDAARRAGASRIMSYVYREDAAHDELWARRYDIESNIRDNQATPLEVALYVRGEWTGGSPLTEEQVARAGIDRKGKMGAVGYRIGRDAGDSVMDALRNGLIDDRDALTIAGFCPGDDVVQRVGLRMALDGSSRAEVLERMAAEVAKQEMQRELGLGGTDLFGHAIDDDAFMTFCSKYVVRRRNELAKDAQYLRTNAGRRNSSTLAEKYGVDVKDPEALRAKLKELDALRERWKHPYTDTELLGEIREAYKAESGEHEESADEVTLRTYQESMGTAGAYTEDHSARGGFKARTGSDKFARDEAGKEPGLRVNVVARLANGKKASKNALVADSSGNTIWGKLPDLDVLHDEEYANKLILMRLGYSSSGFTHIVRKHGQWIMDAMGIDDPVQACKRFIETVMSGVTKIQKRSDMSLVVKSGESERYFIVAIGKDKVLPDYAGIKTAFVADRPARYDSENTLYEANGVLELRIPMSSIGENQRLRVTSESKDRTSDYPVAATPNAPKERMASIGEIVKTETVVPVDKSSRETEDYSVGGSKAFDFKEAKRRGLTYTDPADGQEKFIIPIRNAEGELLARLKSDFTRGQLLGVPTGGHRDVTMGALLQYEELYRNYPELRKLRVRLYNPQMSDDRLGYSSPARNGEAQYIALNVGALRAYGEDAEAQVVKTLLHESQHAIQHFEGFARGFTGNADKGQMIAYLEAAIADRKRSGTDDDWSRDNLAFLEDMLDRVIRTEPSSLDMPNLEWEELSYSVYWLSHGEQEARWTMDAKPGTEVPVWDSEDKGLDSWHTVALRSKAAADMLGGVTFAGMGRFQRLLEGRLGSSGEFMFDRRVFQMYENVVRRARELDMLSSGEGEQGLKLAAEGMALMDSLTAMLPDTYRFALEPYKVYFSSYAKLRGSGSPVEAGAVVPMRGWDARMEGAYERIVREMLREESRMFEREFWGDVLEDFPDLARALPEMRERYAELLEEAKGEFPRERGESPKAMRRRLDLMDVYVMAGMRERFAEELLDLYKATGAMRADRMMAKFLERVRLQLDAFRKDRTLGRIRRAVDVLTPRAGDGGKPVKGHIGAENYRRVLDYVRLMELTRGQRDGFMEQFKPADAPEGSEVYEGMRRWDDVDPAEVLHIVTYDEMGDEIVIDCTKQEYETYACFDVMSSAQAEAAARALGEFIRTGRQAWENAEEAARQRIAARCAPLLEGFSETENERRARRKREERAWVSPVRKVLNLFSGAMNDAQFFDALSGIKEIEPWAREFTDRIARAHVYLECQEKERHAFMMGAVRRAAGSDKPKVVHEWFDRVNRSADTGIVLVPGEPDFLGREHEKLRLQFLGLLRRKTHEKNFRPNKFAEALRFLLSDEQADRLPDALAEEVLAKYGAIGDAEKSKLKGDAALRSLLTAREYERFAHINGSARSRAKKARKKWLAENPDRREDATLAADGESLHLTRLEAAYRVLMCEQEDYREMLALQGYSEEVVGRLMRFAGDDVMRLAYELRDKLGERTGAIREIYERVYGMPFPEVDNYFRAYFDVHHAEKRETTLDGQGTGKAAGSGRVRILYTRQHHNQKLDPTMDVVTAFNAAMREQDVLVGYGDLPSDITRLVNYQQEGVRMVDALHATIGAEATDTMLLHANNMKQLAGGAEETARGLLRILRAFSSPSAVMILNYRVGSLLKQYTGLFNTVAGSDMVTLGEWSRSAGRVSVGLGKISVAELMKRPELDSRFKGWSSSVEKEMLFGYGDNVTPRMAADSAFRAGMSLMEWVDVRANAKSCAILYDAVYRKAQKMNKSATHEELDALAMQEVRRSLALKSQPLDWRQKALIGAKASIFKVGNLFLGGESMNLLGNLARLMARGKKGDYARLAQVWLSHGAALSVLNMVYNFFTDDEEQWKKRNLLANFVLGTALGPMSGVPFASQMFSAVNAVTPRSWGYWLPSSSMLPFADVNRLYHDFRKAFGNKGSWQDRSIAANNVLRALLVGSAAAFTNPRTMTGAAIKAGSYALAAASTVADFLLRVERAAEERL